MWPRCGASSVSRCCRTLGLQAVNVSHSCTASCSQRPATRPTERPRPSAQVVVCTGAELDWARLPVWDLDAHVCLPLSWAEQDSGSGPSVSLQLEQALGFTVSEPPGSFYFCGSWEHAFDGAQGQCVVTGEAELQGQTDTVSTPNQLCSGAGEAECLPRLALHASRAVGSQLHTKLRPCVLLAHSLSSILTAPGHDPVLSSAPSHGLLGLRRHPAFLPYSNQGKSPCFLGD